MVSGGAWGRPVGGGTYASAAGLGGDFLLDTIYLLNSFRKSIPPQNRQLNILIVNCKH